MPGFGTVEACAQLCEKLADCNAFAHVAGNRTCSLHRQDSEELQTPRDELPTTTCVQVGAALSERHCSPPPRTPWVLVVVAKGAHEDLRRWLWYHTLLGINHFVVASNECDAARHGMLVAAAAGAPCAPRIQFINDYRCALNFVVPAYVQAVRLLLRDGARNDTRVGFWDTDEYLVVGASQRTANHAAIDALDEQPGFHRKPMWTFSATVYGDSHRQDEPTRGFVPANLVMAGGAALQHGGLWKSACLLGHMQQGLEQGLEPLFRGGFPRRNVLYGGFVHECTWAPGDTLATMFRNDTARINHYFTKSASAWVGKCRAGGGQAAAGSDRSHMTICTTAQGQQGFLRSLSRRVDLGLYTAMPRKVPLAFLEHEPWPQPVLAALQEACRTPEAAGTPLCHAV